jgi:hypothetical protein
MYLQLEFKKFRNILKTINQILYIKDKIHYLDSHHPNKKKN